MPSATRSSSGSASPPRRWRAASSRTSPRSTGDDPTPTPAPGRACATRPTVVWPTETTRPPGRAPAGGRRCARPRPAGRRSPGAAATTTTDRTVPSAPRAARRDHAPTQARAQEQRILDQRARAVRERDLGLFLRRVDRTRPGAGGPAARYFRNLVQLPLADVRATRCRTEQWDVAAPAAVGRATCSVPQVTLTHAAARGTTPCPSSAPSASCSPSAKGARHDRLGPHGDRRSRSSRAHPPPGT